MLITLLLSVASAAQNNLENGYEYVDLGLPSGAMWATKNIGSHSKRPQPYLHTLSATPKKQDQWKICGDKLSLLPNCEWNQKQEHKKTALEQCGMLRIWRRDCATLRHWKRVPMPPTTQSLRHPLTRVHHIAPRIKTARRFTAKNP